MADEEQQPQRPTAGVGKNAAYNTVKTVFGIIFPLITFPYISRVLGVDNVGKISYGSSIVSYFSLVAALGITTYAVRECAKVRADRDKLSDTASQILSINVISTVIAYAALFALLAAARVLDDYRELILIQSAAILFTTLGADWLNTAMEDFRFIAIRTIAMQAASLILMFAFVHQPEDYVVYAVISVVASSGANIVNILYRRRFCKTRFTLRIDWRRHLPPILILFSMLLAQTIYTSSDQTMLGLMRGDTEVGLYSTSVKIYNMVNTVVASIAVVVMPRLAKQFADGDQKAVTGTLRYALSFIVTLGMPCLVGLNLITVPMLYTLAGADYTAAATSMHVLTIALAFSFAGGFLGNIIMIPSGRDKVPLASSVVSAIVNFVLNFVFIPLWGLNGAAFTTVVAEAVGVVVLATHLPPGVRIGRIWGLFKAPLVGCVSIVVVGVAVQLLVGNYYLVTLLTVLFAMVAYAACLFLFKNELFLGFVGSVKRKIGRTS